MGPAAVRTHPDLVRATYLATHRAGYAQRVASYLREMFRGVDAEPRRYVLANDELRRIAPPVLVLWGHDDTNFQLLEEVQAKVARMPHGRFKVVAGGYEPWLDDLDACTRHIAAFHAG